MRTSLSSWRSTLTKLGLRKPLRRRKRRLMLSRRRPAIETLESRYLLSLTVNTAQDENDGYDVGAKSLREAIAHAFANPGTDTIEFDPSLAGQTIELTLGQITINSDVNIVGLGAHSITIDANGSAGNSRRIFTITSGQTVSISGVTLTGGHMQPSNIHGGAIFNSGNLSLSSVIAVGNYAGGNGGAVWSNGGTLKITDSTFTQNSAGNGGAISVNSNAAGAFISERSAFIKNQANNYGALHLTGGGSGTANTVDQSMAKAPYLNPPLPVATDGGDAPYTSTPWVPCYGGDDYEARLAQNALPKLVRFWSAAFVAPVAAPSLDPYFCDGAEVPCL